MSNENSMEEKKMTTLQDLADHTRTDKNSPGGHNYFSVYEALFAPLRTTTNTVLEIGIDKGGSIKLWSDFFTEAKIVGLDIRRPKLDDDVVNLSRAQLFLNTNAYSLDFFERELLGKVQCDVVIDDGPHTLASMLQFVVMYSKLLTDNGVLIVEDVQDIEWIDALRSVVPDHLRSFVEVHDLRPIANRGDDILFVINRNKRPPLEKPLICVSGMQGLGNTLYQIACAIDYCERTPGASIALLKHPQEFCTGTAETSNRRQALRDAEGNIVPYSESILSKFRFVEEFPRPSQVFANNYEGTHATWNREVHLEIAGYQQHRNLFQRTMQSWPRYFNLYNKHMVKALCKKYAPNDHKQDSWMQQDPRAWFKQCVCIGIRRCDDFKHMNSITNRAINRVKKEFYPNHTALIVSDVGNADPIVDGDEPLDFDVIFVNEPDIVQLNLAFLCNAMIVSESTFHTWLAYFMETAQPTTDITCFNNTDLTRRHLALDKWRHVDL